MRLVKNEFEEYWVNDKNQYHGDYKSWHINDQLDCHCFHFNDKIHGEFKVWDENGNLYYHEYWSHGEVVRNLIKEPVTDDEEKFMLTLEHGGRWLCD